MQILFNDVWRDSPSSVLFSPPPTSSSSSRLWISRNWGYLSTVRPSTTDYCVIRPMDLRKKAIPNTDRDKAGKATCLKWIRAPNLICYLTSAPLSDQEPCHMQHWFQCLPTCRCPFEPINNGPEQIPLLRINGQVAPRSQLSILWHRYVRANK